MPHKQGKKGNNPFKGNKGKKKNNPYGGRKGGKKVNPAAYKGKAAKQGFIRNIISDGKISKNEARNAASLGISQQRIERSWNDSFRGGNAYTPNPLSTSRFPAPPPSPGGYMPGMSVGRPYKPLRIGNKATSLLSQQQQPVAAIPQNPVVPQGGGNTVPIDTSPENETEDDFDAFANFMAGFASVLDALKPEPYEPLPEPTTYASIGQAAQSAPGVKARRSKASQNMASSLGTRGSFNRGGLRISNLNL